MWEKVYSRDVILPGNIIFVFQSTFQECLVDARMLEHISKKEHQKYLKLVDGFHRFVFTAALLLIVDCALRKWQYFCVLLNLYGKEAELKQYMYKNHVSH